MRGEVTCAAGDVACLIEAITQANGNGVATTITLEAGTYTFTDVADTTDGPNGLPSVTGVVTLQGAGAEATILERDAGAPRFRLAHVGATGVLALRGLTLRQGAAFPSVISGTAGFGGGILNAGTLALTDGALLDNEADFGGGLANRGGLVTVARSRLVGNAAGHPGGAVYTEGGVVTVRESTLAGNVADGGGAVSNAGGTVVLTDSAVVDNESPVQSSGGLTNGTSGEGGVLVVTNTTIARNRVRTSITVGTAAGLTSFGGTVLLTNATVAGNTSPDGDVGGVGVLGGVLALQNTLVALNTGRAGTPADCTGAVTSLGSNLLGDPSGCTVTLQPTDLTGDPGLGDFTDDGTPGNGHFPLVKGSPAIDAGNPAVCPPTDQLGQRRVGRCDIGAVEFQGKDHKRH